MNNDDRSLPPRLNYASLTAPVRSADIEAFKSKVPEAATRFFNERFLKIGIGYLGLLLVLPLCIGQLISGNIGGVLKTLVFGLCLTAVAALGISYWVRRELARLARLNRFATDNGLEFIYYVSDPGYKGMIFDEGRSRRIQQALRFPGGMELGSYEYVTGSGKNQQTHLFGYARVKLARRLPHTVLDSRQNNFLGMTNLPDIYQNSQSLKLEGDFNTYFDLYAPSEYARDALYVFTPDVMAAMIDNSQKYDMEIVDDELYIYQAVPFNIQDEASLTKILHVIDTISAEVRDQSARYSDERIGDRQQNVVAEQGRRLKTGKNWLFVALIGCMILAYSFQFLVTEFSLFFYIGSVVIVWTIIILVLLQRIKRR